MGLGKTNPKRQMMINMMYLVLTALLALNVSKQVLKAFELVNSGLESTNTAFTDKNNKTYAEFAEDMKNQPEKTKALNDKANVVREASKKIIEDVEAMKQSLITENGKIKPDEAYETPATKEDLKSASDIEIGTNFFTGPKDKGGGHGEELQAMLKAYRAKMEALIDPRDKDRLININDADPKVKEEADFHGNKWAHYYFGEVPMVADLTILTKIQNDIKNTESNLTDYFINQIGKTDFHFDNLQAIVTSDKPIVLQGQKYEANIFLGAYDSKVTPDIKVGGSALQVKDGVAKYEVNASGEGQKEFEGDIQVKDPTGAIKKYHFKQAYQVFTGSAVIAAEKMNVLYVGLDNPINISVPGYPPDKIRVSYTGLQSWTGAKGKYIAKPVDNPQNPKAMITVSVETNDKSVKLMGHQEFRIKRVPKPKVMLGTKEGGSINKVEIALQKTVRAALENFVFEGINYTVQKYMLTFVPKGAGRQVMGPETVTGQLIPGNFQGAIQGARTGDMLLISDITAMGPTGAVKIGQGPTFIIQ